MAAGDAPVDPAGGHEPTLQETMAFAHAVQPALQMLDVVANQPVQGEAMHKVIGYHAAQALVQVGWQHPRSTSLVNVGQWDGVYEAEGYIPIYKVVDAARRSE